jgi:predicted nucleotidyltransferase
MKDPNIRPIKNRFGLLDADIVLIIKTLRKYSKVKSAFIFGSRATGNYDHGSDVDIALKGPELDFDTIRKISYWLNEETTMPYNFDLLNYEKINEPLLKEDIDKMGVEIYSIKVINSHSIVIF